MKEQTMTSIDPELKKKAKDAQINLSELLENAIRRKFETRIEIPEQIPAEETEEHKRIAALAFEFVGQFRTEILQAYHDALNDVPFDRNKMINIKLPKDDIRKS